jgi:hypothetical protein
VGVLIWLRRLRPAFARLNGFRGISSAAPAVFHGPLPRALWSSVWSSLAKPAHTIRATEDIMDDENESIDG